MTGRGPRYELVFQQQSCVGDGDGPSHDVYEGDRKFLGVVLGNYVADTIRGKDVVYKLECLTRAEYEWLREQLLARGVPQERFFGTYLRLRTTPSTAPGALPCFMGEIR